jgi:hypothetical protein
MRLWVLALVLVPLQAGGAYAGPRDSGSFAVPPQADTPGPRLNFRLVADPEPSTSPVHNSGMIAQTNITPDAVIGFGLLKTAVKKPGSGEWGQEGSGPRSRKAAVTFKLRF